MVKRFHGSRRFIFTGSWSATHVLLSFVFFTKNRQFAAIDCDVFMCGSYRIAGSEQCPDVWARMYGFFTSTYIYTYIHTCVHTHIHTYVHTYIHSDTQGKYMHTIAKYHKTLSLKHISVCQFKFYKIIILIIQIYVYIKIYFKKTNDDVWCRRWRRRVQRSAEKCSRDC